jgi:hypothetical protein
MTTRADISATVARAGLVTVGWRVGFDSLSDMGLV